jgi:hypothetical protein
MSDTNAQTALPIKKLSLFKNGTAMVIREGSTPVRKGVAVLPVPDNLLYGTYFLGSTKDNGIKHLTVRNDTIKKSEKATQIWQLLAGNIGKTATLNISPLQRVDRAITGKIIDYNQQSSTVSIKQDNGKIATLNSMDVYMVEFVDESTKTYLADSIHRMISITPQSSTESLSLQEVYLQSGINWIPSYFLKLKDAKVARLEMKATLENATNDIMTDAETELIVGAPQMTNSGKPDPMTYDYLTVDESPVAASEGLYSNNMMQKSARMNVMADASGAFTQNFATEGEKNADMYIYKIGKVSLDKNTKGVYPIFAGAVDYKDKYEGSIPDNTNYFYNRVPMADDATFDVFHSLEIKNNTTVPLTTAPVTIINDKDQFMAQDHIKYTPVGGSSVIRLSKAVDIILKNNEEEGSRTDNAKKVGKQLFSSIILKGTVNVENYQDKEVTLSLTKAVNGGVLAVDNNGKTTRRKNYSNINPFSEIKWEIKLAPNQKTALTYQYEVFFNP